MPPGVLSQVEKELLSLRPSDVITKSRLAKGAKMDAKSAEDILIELVSEGILNMIVAVECEDEESHIHLYDSLEEYAKAPQECSECGARMDFSNAKVGFKRSLQ